MEIKATLLPGQNGTKRLQSHYGDKLVCVRYRYDKSLKKRFKTIELIIEEVDWIPPLPQLQDDTDCLINIGHTEISLQQKVKAAKGIWVPSEKAWKLPWREVRTLGLESRLKENRKP